MCWQVFILYVLKRTMANATSSPALCQQFDVLVVENGISQGMMLHLPWFFKEVKRIALITEEREKLPYTALVRTAPNQQDFPESASEESPRNSVQAESTSAVFDTSNGEVYLSSKAGHAADGKFRKFGANLLFDSHKFENTESNNRVRLFRNLDWPWYFLGQETVVLTRPQSNGNSTVSISWPGYIGTLSGINNNGLALTENQCGFGINLNGIPNPLLFTDILDTCKNVGEASQVIEKGLHGSTMNLVIADKTSAKSYELGGNGNLSCVGEIN
jgi:hypothetical protein